MKGQENVLSRVINSVKGQLELVIDEKSDSYIVKLPFKDSMGDNLVIRVRCNDGQYLIDDAGTIENTIFTIRETIGDRKSEQLERTLANSFGASINLDEGVIEMEVGSDEVENSILNLTKLMLTLDTMLNQRISEERTIERPHRQSLGPRASQRIRKSLHPLISEGLVNYRRTVSGLTIPDWLVDFVYKPRVQPLTQTSELIVIITVDLAVVDPIVKSAHAFSRAVDIKAEHRNYELKIAYDTHGQNSNSENAANFLREHQLYRNEYETIDLSESENYMMLITEINREVALDLRY